MTIYLSIRFSKEMEEIPVPLSISLEINGTSYLCSWDWTDYGKNSEDNTLVEYRLKGVAVENESTPEIYGIGMLKDNSTVKFEEINYEEMNSEEEFEDKIESLKIEEDDVSITVI